MRRWDIFCRVIDNFGDIGTCWRLAQQLATEHMADVRLWVDNLDTFAQICPVIRADAVGQRLGAVEIRHWSTDFPIVEVADVVIEAFACEIPATYLAAMAQRTDPPIWINLEYLSAEPWVEDCHLLTSPHSTLPLRKHFFFPGFTNKTGGLLQERDLSITRAAFDSVTASEPRHRRDINPPATNLAINTYGNSCNSNEELFVSMFCYDNPALPELLQSMADGPQAVCVLATHGSASRQIATWFEAEFVPDCTLTRNSLTVQALPFLSQAEYDQLLWGCDVNFVRGEDSFVRAQWAQRPFVWQIYPQTEDAHQIKLDAFLLRYTEGFSQSEVVRDCWKAWNGIGNIGDSWQNFLAIRQSVQQHAKVWAFQLDQAGNLANNLFRFVGER